MPKLLFIIKLLIQEKFTGSLEIHFFKGGVAKVKKHEDCDVASAKDLTEAEFLK